MNAVNYTHSNYRRTYDEYSRVQKQTSETKDGVCLLLKLGTSIKHVEPALRKESERRGGAWADEEIHSAITSLRKVADHKRKQKKVYNITDDVEATLNGERYLLENGDQISLL